MKVCLVKVFTGVGTINYPEGISFIGLFAMKDNLFTMTPEALDRKGQK